MEEVFTSGSLLKLEQLTEILIKVVKGESRMKRLVVEDQLQYIVNTFVIEHFANNNVIVNKDVIEHFANDNVIDVIDIELLRQAKEKIDIELLPKRRVR